MPEDRDSHQGCQGPRDGPRSPQWLYGNITNQHRCDVPPTCCLAKVDTANVIKIWGPNQPSIDYLEVGSISGTVLVPPP